MDRVQKLIANSGYCSRRKAEELILKKKVLVNGKVANSFAPNRSTPRDLPVSQYGFVQDSEGNLTYDSPNETNEFLYTSQGSASEQYQGTCNLSKLRRWVLWFFI